jgi:hypothetical protein
MQLNLSRCSWFRFIANWLRIVAIRQWPIANLQWLIVGWIRIIASCFWPFSHVQWSCSREKRWKNKQQRINYSQHGQITACTDENTGSNAQNTPNNGP